MSHLEEVSEIHRAIQLATQDRVGEDREPLRSLTVGLTEERQAAEIAGKMATPRPDNVSCTINIFITNFTNIFNRSYQLLPIPVKTQYL